MAYSTTTAWVTDVDPLMVIVPGADTPSPATCAVDVTPLLGDTVTIENRSPQMPHITSREETTA